MEIFYIHKKKNSCSLYFWIFLTILQIQFKRIIGYNLDTKLPVIHRGERGTFFGFSVAIHREGDENMLIVGAPRGDSNIPGVETTGAIYKCPLQPIHDPGECHIINLETQPGGEFRNKSNEWLGATVRSSGADGSVLSCAPMFKDMRFSHVEPIGKCFLSSSNFTKKKPLTPCKANSAHSTGFEYATHCQAGMSADIYEGGCILGGPGSYSARGSIYVRKGGTNGAFISSGSDKNVPYGTYQGYSVAYGSLCGIPRKTDFVTGAPRAANLLGMVMIYSLGKKLQKEHEIIGQQAGSYFGHSVAVSDLNDDGFDDLIVSAPSYWNKETRQTDVGQIYIYYQNEQSIRCNIEEITSTITGYTSGGRFGFTLVTMGDINDDGVNDLAVSAPFEGDGTVYIFNGKRGAKINTRPSQIIRPSDFRPTIIMKRFGYSMASNRDADNNSIPDLAVGAYETDIVILMRSRPIIRPTITISFDSLGINLTKETYFNSTNTSYSFQVQTCLSYRGVGTADVVPFQIRLEIDAEKHKARAWFTAERGRQSVITQHIVISKEVVYCENMTAMVKNPRKFQDKISPISVRYTVELVHDGYNLSVNELSPMLQMHNLYEENHMPIYYNCLNERCAPNLILSVYSDTNILYMGDSGHVSLTVVVTNQGDDAFGARVHIIIPRSFGFSSHEAIQSELSIICEDHSDSSTIVCKIGNPFPMDTEIIFLLNLEIPTVPGNSEELQIHLSVNSTTEEYFHDSVDNNDTVTIKLEPNVNIAIGGFSNLDQLVFKDKQIDDSDDFIHETDVGEEIVHYYWVQNLGPAVIESATLEISWPMRTEDANYLLYLVEMSLSNGQTCDIIGDDVNPLLLTLSQTSLRDTSYIFNETDADETEFYHLQKRGSEFFAGPPYDQILQVTATSYKNEPNRANCSEPYGGCIQIRCNLTNLLPNSDKIVLTIRSRLWTLSIQNEESRSWDIESMARFTVNRLPYIVQPTYLPTDIESLSLRAIPNTVKEKELLPLWAIILSVSLGISLLLVIVIGLWMIGFFKRRKKMKLKQLSSEDTEEDSDITSSGEAMYPIILNPR